MPAKILATALALAAALTACGTAPAAKPSASTVKDARDAQWFLLGSYQLEGIGLQSTVINLPFGVFATYLKFDNGFGGVYTAGAMVAPHQGPTVNQGFGVYAVNNGFGSFFNALAIQTNFGPSPAGTTTDVYYTTAR